jgi:hypothetical protein
MTLKNSHHLRAVVPGAVIITLLAGIALPGGLIVPVFGASEKDWHRHSFWYSPWGASGCIRE